MTVYTNKYDYRKKLQLMQNWNIPEAEKEKLREYANEYASGRITGRIGKNIDGSIEDSLAKLKLPISFINKPFNEITEDDLKHFVDCLIQDRIQKKVRKNVNGRLKWVEIGNYQKKGKDKFLKNLALYLKFRLADEPDRLTRYLKVVKVIITHVAREPESLTYDDFEKIYNNCPTLCDRYYMLVNVWGGFRASEFHGIRESDIYLPDPEKNEEFVRIWIRHANSKTKGRMITLYGNDCNKVVSAYLAQRQLEGLRPDEPVFEKSHNSRKLWLRRLGNKFSLHMHPHLFRSTCATWLVDKGILKSYTELIEFFGWTYGSTIPNRYLNRSGITLQRLDNDVKQTRLEELKKTMEKQQTIHENQKLRSEVNRRDQERRITHLEKEKKKTNELIKSLVKQVTQLQAVLRSQQGQLPKL